jgi:hypothetical protein
MNARGENKPLAERTRAAMAAGNPQRSRWPTSWNAHHVSRLIVQKSGADDVHLIGFRLLSEQVFT